MKNENLIHLRKDSVDEIKELLDEIIGNLIYRLEHPDADEDEFVDDESISKDFEKLERLLDIVCEIDNLLEERRGNIGK